MKDIRNHLLRGAMICYQLHPHMTHRQPALPAFHPQTILRDWGDGQAFRLVDSLAGVCVFGATGSGKTSGPAKHLAYGYLAANFGGLVLCAKKEECLQWQKWAADCGRIGDLVIINADGKNGFNFLNWEASRADKSGGLTINIVAILDEIAGAVARSQGQSEKGGGNSKFWEDALHHMLTHLVALAQFAGSEVSLPVLRSIVNSAPIDTAKLQDPFWQEKSKCAIALKDAEKLTKSASTEIRADFEETKAYWEETFPQLNEKTRSIITLTFSMLVTPFLTRPLRTLFCGETSIKPEDTFAGKIIIVDLPVQDYRLAGKVANLAWKFCFQVAVLRRSPPGMPDTYLRPVFLWADEAHNFVSAYDSEYQAVARSAGGATVYLTQNRESYRRVLSNNDGVDSFLGNLQTKIFCQNTGETNEWASKLLAERWTEIASANIGHSGNQGEPPSSNIGVKQEKRHFIEPSDFLTLKRGGEIYDFQVEAVVFSGGKLFPNNITGSAELLPFKFITFNQK